MNQSKEKELIKKIVEAVPGIMDLKSGCIFISDKEDPIEKCIVLSEEDISGNVWYLSAFDNTLKSEKVEYIKKNCEIIGRPITFEDCALAIHYEGSIPYNVRMVKELSERWKFGIPLSKQSEKLKEWLWEVICEK